MTFRIEPTDTGTFVLVDEDTGQTTIYATQREAEEAKEHLSKRQTLGPGLHVDPDKVRP